MAAIRASSYASAKEALEEANDCYTVSDQAQDPVTVFVPMPSPNDLSHTLLGPI